jgi:hypothetical protein
MKQSDIDNFQSNYAGCTQLQGNVSIQGDDINNLIGLGTMRSVSGNIDISGNPNLSELSGLDGLISVGGSLNISFNDILTDLSGLMGLDSIGPTLMIDGNNSLWSLHGIDSIEPSTIGDLLIYENPLLSECDVQSICDYLANTVHYADIYSNAPGCMNEVEIEEACEPEYLSDPGIISGISVYPVPAGKEICISGDYPVTINEITLYNETGQQVSRQLFTGEPIDVSTLKPGFYIIELKTSQGFFRRKIIIQ